MLRATAECNGEKRETVVFVYLMNTSEGAPISSHTHTHTHKHTHTHTQQKKDVSEKKILC